LENSYDFFFSFWPVKSEPERFAAVLRNLEDPVLVFIRLRLLHFQFLADELESEVVVVFEDYSCIG
jgi:hypothetical protein